jgi:hypothetical protein
VMLFDDLAACWAIQLACAHLGQVSCFHDHSPIHLFKLGIQYINKQLLM